jgi:hypothetical protein
MEVELRWGAAGGGLGLVIQEANLPGGGTEVVVTAVAPDGPNAAAGIAVGSALLAVDGTRDIRDRSQVLSLLQHARDRFAPGDPAAAVGVCLRPPARPAALNSFPTAAARRSACQADSAITASIVGSTVHDDATFYTIIVNDGRGGEWTTEKRFSQFAQLKKDLKAGTFDAFKETNAFKNFPKAGKFEKGMKGKVVEKRKMLLAPFLAQLAVHHFDEPEVIDFLQPTFDGARVSAVRNSVTNSNTSPKATSREGQSTTGGYSLATGGLDIARESTGAIVKTGMQWENIHFQMSGVGDFFPAKAMVDEQTGAILIESSGIIREFCPPGSLGKPKTIRKDFPHSFRLDTTQPCEVTMSAGGGMGLEKATPCQKIIIAFSGGPDKARWSTHLSVHYIQREESTGRLKAIKGLKQGF